MGVCRGQWEQLLFRRLAQIFSLNYRPYIHRTRALAPWNTKASTGDAVAAQLLHNREGHFPYVVDIEPA